jgi:hypothetical protein
VCLELTAGATAPDEVSGHGDLVVVGDAEHAAVEKLVVEAAQAESAVDRVGPFEGPPADVRRVQSDRFGPEPAVVAAHRAAVLVGNEDKPAEQRVASTKLLHSGTHCGHFDRFEVEPGGCAEVVME